MPFGSRTNQTANFCLNRSSTWPTWISLGNPALKVGGGSKRTLGNMKRVVAVAAASIDAVNAVHASVTHERKERRVTIGSFAAGLGGAGFGVSAGGAVGAAFFDSSMLIGNLL